MTKEEFLNEMQDVLQTDETLTYETRLSSLIEWDSLAMMATLAFLERQFRVDASLNEFKAMQTIGDVAAKAGLK